MNMAELKDLRNYESVEAAQKEDSSIEINRYMQKGYCRILPWEELHRRYPEGTASRLALILKQKPDGSTKRRIVIDMKRSKGNDRSNIRERIVLPRAQDIFNSLSALEKENYENKRQEEPS